MLIDWFTVGAQALNFLILVWLLKRFLYKPILNALDAREKRIAKELADANSQRAEAEKKRKEYEQRNEKFDQQREELLSEAKENAKAERQRLLEEARQAAEDLRGKRQDALTREHQNLRDEITRRTQEEVFAIARKTLADLAGASLEESMADLFSRRLHELEGEAKETLVEALKAASEPTVVRSAFDLPSKQQKLIQKTLKETFSDNIEVRFETAPQVIGGIELVAQGRKVAWSIEDYLASLERSIAELLKEKTRPKAKAKSREKNESEPESEEEAEPETKEDSRSESKSEGKGATSEKTK
jgi:F-type H+-transporting ATPase subunit b